MTDRGDVSRRRFLGAAAALSALPAANAAGGPQSDASRESGAQADESDREVFAAFSTDQGDFEATYDVRALPDAANHSAQLSVSMKVGVFTLGLHPEEIEQLIGELEEARESFA